MFSICGRWTWWKAEVRPAAKKEVEVHGEEDRGVLGGPFWLLGEKGAGSEALPAFSRRVNAASPGTLAAPR